MEFFTRNISGTAIYYLIGHSLPHQCYIAVIVESELFANTEILTHHVRRKRATCSLTYFEVADVKRKPPEAWIKVAKVLRKNNEAKKKYSQEVG